ncbi:hypothetical protein [Trinickia acidisoli]|uniref:hypothetical protein n=1 Tax=Trinickia acidisoli TaxID=2767482 RepID=UPI001A8D805A|nr:hypothetical protein [Trinickia acidisoli]
MALTDEVREANEISRAMLRSCEILGASNVFDDSVESRETALLKDSAATSESVLAVMRRDALGLASETSSVAVRGGALEPLVPTCCRQGRKSENSALAAGASARKRTEGVRGETFRGSAEFDEPTAPVEIRLLSI